MTFGFKKHMLSVLMVLQLAFLIAIPANAEIGYFNDTDETEVEEVIELEQEQQQQPVTTDENQEQEQKIIKEEVKTEPIKLNVEKTDLQEIITPQEQEELPLKKKQNPLNLLKSTGYKFDNGIIKSQRFTFFSHGSFFMQAQNGSKFVDHTEFVANEFQSSTLFADNKTRLDWGYNFSRPTEYNSNFFAKISFAELWHEINEHQTVMIGNTRIQNGIEGGLSSSLLKFVARSQIARNFGNGISNSIRNKGTYEYLDYDIAFSD